MSVLVAAIGSAHGADSLGWDVADFLVGHIATGHPLLPNWQPEFSNPSVLCIKRYQHPTAALEMINGYTHVYFVDACRAVEMNYGALITVAAEDLKPGSGKFSSHSAGVNDAICLARILKLLPQYCCVMGLNVYPQEQQPVHWVLQQRLISALWSELTRVLLPVPLCETHPVR